MSAFGAGSLPIAVDVEVDAVFGVRGGMGCDLFVDDLQVWCRTRQRGGGSAFGEGVSKMTAAEANGGKMVTVWLQGALKGLV